MKKPGSGSQISKILILVTILAVPGFLYYLLQDKGKNRYRPLAVYGPKEVAPTFHSVRGKQVPDTNYHHVPAFSFINQQGDSVSWNNYAGKITLISLYRTHHGGYAVDYANKVMEGFSEMYQKNNLLYFLSITIDPEEDRPEKLRSYAKQSGVSNAKWDLLTGPADSVYYWINQGLFIDALKVKEAGEDKFHYNNLLVLLDTKHRIRGYYEATNQEALSKLDDEIKVLIAEELRNIKDGR